jgi:hypothetical protein
VMAGLRARGILPATPTPRVPELPDESKMA